MQFFCAELHTKTLVYSRNVTDEDTISFKQKIEEKWKRQTGIKYDEDTATKYTETRTTMLRTDHQRKH